MIENDVGRMILELGFPIVMCLLLFWQSTQVIKKNTEALYAVKNEIARRKK